MPFSLGEVIGADMEWDLLMLLYGLLVGLCAGAVAGCMAGLAGVGGGLVYVPVFYLLMPGSDASMALSVFSSMLAISITTAFSARSHWRLGHVDIYLSLYLLPALLLGASFGLWSALLLPELWVLLSLAALNAWVAYDYGRALPVKSQHKGLFALLGLPIGYVSGVLGIAGGTMLVPLFRRSLSLRNAVGTSAVCSVMMVGMAVLLNLIFEPGWGLLLQQQWNFILATCVGVLITMPTAARKTASWHDTLDERYLRFVLKSMFSLIAILFCFMAWENG
ncbi:MAG: sulfite exporter TauE/SafE family protein [Mariprofundaceae bacterium]|nr:sulfite exporter TauE/SafE family protein [Mariprofundaceae bacterium]